MLYDDDVAFRPRKATDGTGSAETLFDVQVRGRLIEHEDVGILDAYHGTGETLIVAFARAKRLYHQKR